jgi:hypothetical protein
MTSLFLWWVKKVKKKEMSLTMRLDNNNFSVKARIPQIGEAKEESE